MDKSVNVAILQSNYIPWIGYFGIMSQVDHFVILDTVQYTRNDWRNRNRIKTPQGLKWLTIPALHTSQKQKINATFVADKKWPVKHFNTIHHSYSKSLYYDLYSDELSYCYQQAARMERLSEINMLFIYWVKEKLGINTTIHLAEKFTDSPDRTQRLLGICQSLQATEYLSGPAAKAYMDVERFQDSGVAVKWMSYAGYKSYPQLHGNFELSVSTLDLLFNLGPDSSGYLQNSNQKIQ